MKFNSLYGALLFLCCVVGNFALAQVNINTYRQNGSYYFSGLDRVQKQDFFTTYQSALELSSNDLAEEISCYIHDDGYFDCRYRQKHKNYLVEGATFLLHGKQGLVEYAGVSLKILM